MLEFGSPSSALAKKIGLFLVPAQKRSSNVLDVHFCFFPQSQKYPKICFQSSLPSFLHLHSKLNWIRSRLLSTKKLRISMKMAEKHSFANLTSHFANLFFHHSTRQHFNSLEKQAFLKPHSH